MAADAPPSRGARMLEMPAQAWIAACVAPVALSVVLAVPATRAASGCGPWEWVNPLPQGNDLNGVTYGPGMWVAVGDAGTILTSPDAMTWTIREYSAEVDFQAIAWSGLELVAVGGRYNPESGRWNAAVWTSTDGESWQPSQVPEAPLFVDVTWDGARFVALATERSDFWLGSQIFVSEDGLAWLASSQRLLERLEAVVARPGLRVAVGARCFMAPIGYCGWRPFATVSHDDGPWVEATLPAAATWGILNGIADGGGRLVAVGSEGHTFTSTDGTSWEVHESSYPTLTRVEWVNGAFLALAEDDTLVRSADGVAWEPVGGLLPGPVTDFAASGSGLVAVGRSGGMARAADAAVWTRVSTGETSTFASVASGAGRSVAVGWDGTILASEGGQTWRRAAGSTGVFGWTVAWGGLRFVAVGSVGVTAVSSDGVNWSAGSIPDLQSSSGIAWGAGTFVVTDGRNTVSVSADGMTWTMITLAADFELRRVVFARGQFHAFGLAGSTLERFACVFTSPDGLSWSAPLPLVGTSGYLSSVAASAEKFVAVEYNGLIVSDDALTWHPAGPVGEALDSVHWAGARFVALGYSGTILTSLDGLTWNREPRLTEKLLTDVTFDGVSLLAVGWDGAILRAPCVPPYPVRPRLERAEPRRAPTGPDRLPR